MVADIVADMDVDVVADMEVNKVSDKVADKKIPSEMEVALLHKEHLGSYRNIYEHLGISKNI